MMVPAETRRLWDGTELPLPSMPRLHTRDINEVHDHMSRMFCKHDLFIEGGNPPIDFRHNHVSLKTMSFNATDYGNPYGKVMIHIPPMENLYLVQFSLAGIAEISQGDASFKLRPGEMCVLDPDVHIRQAFGEGYKHFIVKLSKDGLNEALSQELGFRPGDLHFHRHALPLDGAAASFAQLARVVCDDLDYGSSAFSDSRAAAALERTMQRLLLMVFPHNHSELLEAPLAAPAPYYVRRVEEYINEHVTDPITLDEMIMVSGVSARSLHAGFRRFRDTTPMKYLKMRRLALAREQLVVAADAGQSVTEVALNCGFSHLSKFARDYLERFGERPSETLKRTSSL